MINGVDYIGLLDCYHYDLKNDEFGYASGYKCKRRGEPVGLGRMLSRNVLSKLNWQLYDPKRHRSLDKSFTDRIAKIPHTKRMLTQKGLGIYGVDVKDGYNRNSFERINTRPCERINIPELKTIHDEKSIICAST
jgi:hypothetical protein